MSEPAAAPLYPFLMRLVTRAGVGPGSMLGARSVLVRTAGGQELQHNRTRVAEVVDGARGLAPVLLGLFFKSVSELGAGQTKLARCLGQVPIGKFHRAHQDRALDLRERAAALEREVLDFDLVPRSSA